MRSLFKNKKKSESASFKYQRRSGFKRTTPIVVLCVVVLIALIWPGVIRRPLEVIGAPLWTLQKEISKSTLISAFGRFTKSKKSMQSEIKILEQKLLIAESRNTELGLLREENLLLNKFLNRKIENEESVFAYVISRPNKTLYDTLLLDVGFESDVEPGDIIAYDDYNILGEIVEVRASTSLAKLFTSPGTQSNVVISSSLATTAVGIGGGNLEITLPRDISVEKGMVVRLEERPNTILGYIESVEKSQTDTFQRILVKSNINIYTMEGILIYKR